ncbi:hypothetical protein DO97_20745 [Neosynechococcus sphagnicola sy1]|uniref:Uncharacterized protein n=2 Tax=Neosynechococcus TaxID=1501143 RepID=A0A098TH89_9CYAN|nr:hypothetical protein DO97_20745 [Neosynechococcus sphagnicola sy1]
MEPSGLYDWKDSEIQNRIEKYGYRYEEFGVYQRKFLIRRSEYDDGAANINGKIIDLDWRATESRMRYLSPYNLVIAAFANPLSNPAFDKTFEQIMNDILMGKASVEDLSRAVLDLPKRSFS